MNRNARSNIGYRSEKRRVNERKSCFEKQYGLIATGGSDFRGQNKMGHMSGLGEMHVPPEAGGKLRMKAEEIKKNFSIVKENL